MPQIETEVFKENMDNPEPQDTTTSSTQMESDRWIEMFNNLNSTLQSLQTQIGELNSLKGKLECFDSTWKVSVDNNISNGQIKHDDSAFRIKLLTNIVIRQEEKIEILE